MTYWSEDIGDGYRSHEPRMPRWQDIIGWTDSQTMHPEWGKPAVEAARAARRQILRAVYACEDRHAILRDASSVASRLRWQTRDAHEAAQRNRQVSDEEVETLSNAAWWAAFDYARADRAYNAVFTAAYRMRERLAEFDKNDQHEHVLVPAHWHGPHCQTCKDANLALAALEERGPKA